MEQLTRNMIVEYFENLAPSNVESTAFAFKDIELTFRAISECVEKLNANRRIKLQQEENEKLQIEIVELENAVKQYEGLSAEHEELINRRNSLLAEKEKISDLQKLEQDIKELEAFIAAGDITVLQERVCNIQEGLEGNVKPVNEWLNNSMTLFIKLDGDFLAETKKMLHEIQVKRENINNSLKKGHVQIEHENLQLSELLVSWGQELTPALEEYNKLVKQLQETRDKLTEIRQKHPQNINIYEKHLGTNKNIFGELGKHQRISEQTALMELEIEALLKKYDAAIKELVEKAQHIVIA